MELPSLKDLNKIIKLCRKTGVKVFELDGLRLTLTDAAPESVIRAAKAQIPKTSQQANTVPNDMPSDEDLMFWSAGGSPSEDSFQQ